MKKFLLSFVFLMSLLMVFSGMVRAQQTTPTPAPNERWVCLDAKRCGDCDDSNGDGLPDPETCYLYPVGDSKFAGCSPNDINNPLTVEHRARLKQVAGKEALPGKDTYIITCLSTTEGDKCTTGASATDNIVYKADNYSTIMQGAPINGYTFDGLFEADGTTKRSLNYIPASESFAEYEWQDYTSQGFDRRYYALNYTDPDLGSGGITGEAATQQQSVLTFSFAEASNKEKCISVQWDPYGRVFDSQTLEPIKGAKVTLLMKRQDGSFTPVTPSDIMGGAITNPYTTKEDGVFNFVVPEGDYKITVEHPDYNFPNSSSILNPQYKKIYWQIYPSQTGEIIQERPPKLEYRDIPLDPKNTSADNEIKLMEYSYTKQKVADTSVVEGRVSDPFALIKAYSNKDNAKYRLLSSQQADRLGRFKIEINETKFEKGETFGQVEYYKIDLTKNLDQKDDASLTTKISQFLKLDPILNYLEGYAYDQSGKILANATVGVYLNFSNRPYYTTKADEQGYYKISSEHLPFFPYVIRYTTSDGTNVKLTTSEFVSQNNQFITGQKVDLSTFKDEKGQTLVKKMAFPTGQPIAVQESSINQSKAFLINAAILVILIIVVVIFLGVYIYRKNRQSRSTYS